VGKISGSTGFLKKLIIHLGGFSEEPEQLVIYFCGFQLTVIPLQTSPCIYLNPKYLGK